MTTALKHIIERMEFFGFPFSVETSLIPTDDTTLFVCSGMQNLKERFRQHDGGRKSTLQSCIRTNDLSLVGDGTHLTYFEMLGNFSFGNNDYETSIELWTAILGDFDLIKDCVVHVHPSDWNGKRILWQHNGFEVVEDEECLWSDGDVGGTCCEVYWKGTEMGNLVNPLKVSTDVGFGWERLLMALEGKSRVDETSLFDQSLTPVQRDHVRCLGNLWLNDIQPGNKGRNYVCRRLLRRLLPFERDCPWQSWLESEHLLRVKCLERGKKMWKRHNDKSLQWWWETCGLTPEDVALIHQHASNSSTSVP